MKLPLTALIPALLAVACAAEPGAENAPAPGTQSQDLEIGLPPDGTYYPIDPCRTVEPDKLYYVLANAAAVSSPSGSGAYGYQTPCNRWVVDFKIATYSPSWEMYGEAWDLPSSNVANGKMPANAQDCGRYATYVTYYRKKSTETAFTNLGSIKFGGSWNGTSCTKVIVSGTMTSAIAPPSTSGWDTWRIAVGTKQRTSWQETRAVGLQYVEPPA
jgi:hypothetical protein